MVTDKFPNGLIGLIGPNPNGLNGLSGPIGLSQKKTPRDSTLKYSPRGLTFSDGPRMTPYHNKLLGEFAYYIYILQILDEGLNQ